MTRLRRLLSMKILGSIKLSKKIKCRGGKINVFKNTSNIVSDESIIDIKGNFNLGMSWEQKIIEKLDFLCKMDLSS